MDYSYLIKNTSKYSINQKIEYYKKLIYSNDIDKIENVLKYLFENDFYTLNKIKINNKNKVIGIITGYARNSGRARVCVDLCNKFINLGYKVVLILEKDYQNIDYAIDDRVVKESLFKEKSRTLKLINIIKKYKISVIINNEIEKDYLSGDFVLYKLMNIHSIMIIHRSFTYSFIHNDLNGLMKTIKQFSLCEELVVTNKLDYDFYKSFFTAVFFVAHPLDYLKKYKTISTPNNNKIVYIARAFDPTKRACDIIKIASELKKLTLDFKIVVVGWGSEKLNPEIINNNLKENIEVVGFKSDIFPYLNDSTIFLTTSIHETYGMNIAEAFYFEKPVVMYDMPYLVFSKSKGIASARVGDYKGVANNLYRLLIDKDSANKMGRANKEFLTHFYNNHNTDKEWIFLINNVINNKEKNKLKHLNYLFEKTIEGPLLESKTDIAHNAHLSFKKELKIFLLFIPHTIKRILKKIKII